MLTYTVFLLIKGRYSAEHYQRLGTFASACNVAQKDELVISISKSNLDQVCSCKAVKALITFSG